eukprot:scaffold129332_cov83-Attheya_sp.AAC.1
MHVKCPYFTELESLTKSHQVSSPSLTKRYVNGAPPNVALLPHHPTKYLEPVSSQPNSGLPVQ